MLAVDIEHSLPNGVHCSEGLSMLRMDLGDGPMTYFWVFVFRCPRPATENGLDSPVL